jgi:predicted permease
VDDELRFHVEQETAANVARGMAPREARRAALAALGGVTQTSEAVGNLRALGLDALWLDVKYGIRSLVTGRRFTIVALLTIVLVVGSVATVFSVVNAVILRPLPYPASGRLVLVKLEDRPGFPIRVPDAVELLDGVRALEQSSIYTLGYAFSLDAETDHPTMVQNRQVTPSLFPMLGIRMALGRPLGPDDARPESPYVAVISHDLWQTRFGGRPGVIGETLPGSLQRDTPPYTIVGVTAPGSDAPLSWMQDTPIVWSAVREPYPSRSATMIGRLAPGASLGSLNAELAARASHLASANPKVYLDRPAASITLLDAVVGDRKPVLWIFFGAVLCVLLIGVANLVSVQAVRNAAREHELAVRAALGASRWRLIRQLVIEATILSLAGTLIGLAAAAAGLQAIVGSLPVRFPRADAIAMDATVVVFAFGVALFVALVVGVLPAWRGTRPELTAGVNEETRSATLGARRSQLQRVMIAVETALALMLLVGGGLLINSFGRLISQDAGMNEEGLWTATVSLPIRYREAAIDAFWTDALAETRTLPQVASAAIVVNSGPPLSGGDIGTRLTPEGQPKDAFQGVRISFRHVGASYFETAGIPVVAGRSFQESDTRSAEPVVIINEAAARTYWPAEDPLGKRLHFMGRLARVVGIIPAFTITRLSAEPTLQLYAPYEPGHGSHTSTLMLRAQQGGSGLPDAVRAIVSHFEPDARIEVATMAGVRWKALADERFRTAVLLAFAGTALFLALVGIFGVVAYSAVQRTREIGVRIALGATRTNVAALLIGDTLAPALVGLVAGAGGAFAASGLLAALVYEIAPTDPATFAGAAVLLALAALAAALLPAWRVSGANPMVALRHE